MKIVEVCSYYPPHLGGIEYVVKNVALQLAANGHDVTVLTSTIGSRRPGTVQNGHLREVYLRGFEFAHTPVILTLPYHIAKMSKDSLIHIHLSHVYTELIVMIVAKLRRMPYVAHYHMDVDVSGRFGFLYKAYKKTLLPLVIRGAAHVITLSDEQRDIIINRYKTLVDNVSVIPNGVGQEFFLKTSHDYKKRPLRLLFVGRFAKQKNLPRLIKTLPLLKIPVELYLVGDGEKKANLQALADDLKLQNVHFDGALHGPDVIAAYQAADVFMLTSDREGMPLVLLEAAAAGLPIIASNVQGLREFIHGNGLLVTDPSPETFAAALNNLSAVDLMRLSKASSRWAQDYTWQKLVKKMIKVFEDASKNN